MIKQINAGTYTNFSLQSSFLKVGRERNRPTFIINSGSCNSLVFKLKCLTIAGETSLQTIAEKQRNALKN